MFKYNFFIIFLLLFVFNFKVVAAPVPYKTVESFNEDRLETVIKNYGLSKSIEASVLLAPIKMSSLNIESDAPDVIIPGLLIGGMKGDLKEDTAGLYEIIKALEDYQRSVSLIITQKVDQVEIDALTAGIKDSLFLRDDETIKVEEKIFSFNEAMKNWKSDFKESAYNSFFKQGNWIWFPIITLFLLLMALFISKSIRSIGRSIENSAQKGIDMADRYASGPSLEEVANAADDSMYSSQVEEEVTNRVYEVDQEDTIKKIIELYYKSQGMLFYTLWENIPKLSKQVSFYKAMSGFTDNKNTIVFDEIINATFHLSDQQLSNEVSNDEFTPEELSKLHTDLFCNLLERGDEIKNNLLVYIYPRYGGFVNELIEASIDDHFKVVFYLFPTKTVNILENNVAKAKSASTKIAASLAAENKEPTESEIQSFIDFVNADETLESAKSSKEGSKGGVSPEKMRMLVAMPDDVLMNGDWSPDILKAIKTQIPNLNWIEDDSKKFKQFLLRLNSKELKYLSDEFLNFNNLYDSLDDRDKIRVDEKLNTVNEKDSFVIRDFRKKISTLYQPTLSTVEDESNLMDASNSGGLKAVPDDEWTSNIDSDAQLQSDVFDDSDVELATDINSQQRSDFFDESVDESLDESVDKSFGESISDDNQISGLDEFNGLETADAEMDVDLEVDDETKDVETERSASVENMDSIAKNDTNESDESDEDGDADDEAA